MQVEFELFWASMRARGVTTWREGVDLEFKTAAGQDGRGELPHSLWETYSAMANTNGGIIVLGVKELRDGSLNVQGVPNSERVTKDFWNVINNPNKVSVNLLKDEDVVCVPFAIGTGVVDLIVICVPRARRAESPVYLNANPVGGTYRRMNDGDFKCPQYIVERMLADRQYDTLDLRIFDKYGLDDVDVSSLMSYRNLFNIRNVAHPFSSLSNEDFLVQMGGFAKDRRTGDAGLTLAGLLMFGKLRSILDAVTTYVVDYREYGKAGENDRWIDRLTTDFSWSGNLFEFCVKTLQRLYADLKVPFMLRKDGVRDDESPVHIALREALVNTLIHADYSGSSPVVVVKYPGHYEFANPGLLRVPKARVFQGGVANSDCRNRTLQKMFEMIGYAEQAGSGFPKILSGWRSQDWKRPALTEDVELFQTHLLMPRVSLYPEEIVAAVKNLFGEKLSGLSPLERLIVVEAYSAERINHASLMDLTDEHHSDVSDALKRLVDCGLLKSEGRGRGTSYRLSRGDELLNEPLNEPLNLSASQRLTMRIYDEIYRNPGVNQKKLCGILSVSAASVKRHIELLNGRVEHRGSKKTGGYYICEG